MPDKECKKLILEAEIRGITRFAWWKDGVQYVGCGMLTLKDALSPLKIKENEDA